MALLYAETKYGTVRGTYGNNHAYSVFRGIPYAKPPVGEMRWKRPEEPEAWEGVRDCLEWGPIPMQGSRPTKGKIALFTRSHYPRNDMPRSEDCLYLNVWTPADSPSEKLPVAVWIFGGGFVWGFGHQNMFDGEAFNKQGCILVTINYRLGIFGFMAHEELTAEDREHHTSGNYGLYDQLAALRWVRENIAAFGGDPENVTIFGQSAGAICCMNLECSPLAKGLFHRVIMQSGGGISFESVKATDLTAAEVIGREELAKIGIGSIAEARALTTEELFSRIEEKGMDLISNNRFRPITDGWFMPESVLSQIAKGKNNGSQIMIGCNADEDAAFPKDIYETAEKIFGERGEAFLSAIGAADRKMPADVYGSYGMRFHSGQYTWNRWNEEHGIPTSYTYLFGKNVPGGGGAFHGGEHFYIFETLSRDWRPYDGSDFDLSILMNRYWTNFVKNGDPNGEGLPRWDRYGIHGQTMVFSGQSGMADDRPTPDVRFDAEETLSAMRAIAGEGSRK